MVAIAIMEASFVHLAPVAILPGPSLCFYYKNHPCNIDSKVLKVNLINVYQGIAQTPPPGGVNIPPVQ